MPPKGGLAVAGELKALKEKYATLEARDRRRRTNEGESDQEEEGENEVPQEIDLDPEEARTVRLLKEVKTSDHKAKEDLPMYGGKLDGEELIGWIGALENYFECEEVEENQKVKVAKSRLKGHALLWWDCVQADRWKKDKPKITSWNKMVEKMKGKFLPNDYNV